MVSRLDELAMQDKVADADAVVGKQAVQRKRSRVVAAGVRVDRPVAYIVSYKVRSVGRLCNSSLHTHPCSPLARDQPRGSSDLRSHPDGRTSSDLQQSSVGVRRRSRESGTDLVLDDLGEQQCERFSLSESANENSNASVKRARCCRFEHSEDAILDRSRVTTTLPRSSERLSEAQQRIR